MIEAKANKLSNIDYKVYVEKAVDFEFYLHKMEEEYEKEDEEMMIRLIKIRGSLWT